MHLALLTYAQGADKVFVIERAWSLVAARLRVSIRHGIDSYFLRGELVPDEARVPEELLGRVLDEERGHKLVTKLERPRSKTDGK